MEGHCLCLQETYVVSCYVQNKEKHVYTRTQVFHSQHWDRIHALDV